MNTSAPQSGTLHVTKECSEYAGEAGSFCTIASSNFDAIPVGSKVVYAKPATADGGIDTDIVVNTPNGDAAHGHVLLDGATQTGTVTLAGGTGSWRNWRPTSWSRLSPNPTTAGRDRTRTESDQRGCSKGREPASPANP